MPEPSQLAPTPAVCAFVQRTITAAMNRVRVARWIGEQAVTYGRREIVKAFEAGANLSGPHDKPTAGPGLSVDRWPTEDVRGAGVTIADDASARPITAALAAELAALTLDLDLDVDVRSAAVATPVAHGAPPVVAAPPFDGYDTLPAAHIVQRLTRLTPVELAAVRAYEIGHRGRRTVVAKVDQLLDAG